MKPLIHLTLTAASMALIAHAQTPEAVLRDAVERALPALQKAGPVFAAKNGCISCHHQTLPAQTTAMAAALGYRYDHTTEEEQTRAILKVIEPARELLAEGSDVVPQIAVSGAHILMALHAQAYAPDDTTAAVVHNIALRQRPDGSWTGFATRPPISGGDIRETALAVRGLDLYAPQGRRAEMNKRIARGRDFLLESTADTPEEAIVRLQGLVWAGASPADLEAAGAGVLGLQREDGGWAQLETRGSDAYATGEALLALYSAGVLTPEDDAYQRGVRYLLHSQEDDGSWHVATRAFPFQPLIDTGYPHGRDQWISAAGTSYALMALMLAVN
jgi:squalene cyclase